MPPSEIDQMSYWEFEEWIKRLNKRVKEEEEERKRQDAHQKSQMPNFNMSKFNPNSIMNNIPKYK
jgi:hypothetical protein